MTTLRCDICLEEKIENPIKCNKCEFFSHKECLTKWCTSCNNYLCPHCKNDKSYDIDYDNIKIVKPIKLNFIFNIEDLLTILNDTSNNNYYNQERRNRINNNIISIVNNVNANANVDINANVDVDDDDDELPELGLPDELPELGFVGNEME